MVKEDPSNPDVLYLGTEFGGWFTLDRGVTWHEFDLPTVPVHDFEVSEAAQELVAGTHGRSIWIADISTLRQIHAADLREPVRLYQPKLAVLWKSDVRRGGTLRRYEGDNPPNGAIIRYSLAEDVTGLVLEIHGPGGKVLRTLEADGKAGLHTVRWDLRREPEERAGGNGRFRRRFAPLVKPGEYEVVLKSGDTVRRADLVVEIDPKYPDPVWLETEYLEEEFFRGDDDAEEEGAEEAAEDRDEEEAVAVRVVERYL